MVTPPPSWSSILQGIIKSTSERQRLSTALGVTNMTLSRWASGESRPQRQHLVNLLQVVQPSQRLELLEALEMQFSDIHTWLTEETPDSIPPDFFAQVLNIRTTTTEGLRFWRISDMVLKQALAQLDPHHMGMAVKIVQCMPLSDDGKVRSLRERAGKGTLPWPSDLEHDVLFLGLESLSGYAVDIRHIAKDNNLKQLKEYPAVQDEFEVSAAAHPIRFEGRIAGCLLASSAQKDYFTQPRINLLIMFSDLIALAFDKDDFYSPDMIDLRVMPKLDFQREVLVNFRQRVIEKFQQAMYQQKHFSNAEIELQVWQDFERQLLSSHYEITEPYHS